MLEKHLWLKLHHCREKQCLAQNVEWGVLKVFLVGVRWKISKILWAGMRWSPGKGDFFGLFSY